MPHPILAKLPEHLARVQSIKENPAKIILIALLATETDLLWNGFKTTQERVERWKNQLIASDIHDGDCISCSSPCLLCHTLDDITIADETIEESKELLGENPSLLELVEVFLTTQPEKKYESYDEFSKQTGSFVSMIRAITYEDDTIKRIEKWRTLDPQVKAETQKVIQSLLITATIQT